ncbi:MAG: ribose 5-phosphate isomerase B [Dehalococcoidia bacterium]|jgi:ribose 5-phosphate isomerase B
MIVALGSDHRGIDLKSKIADFLKAGGHTVLDFGTNSNESVDYPDFASPVAQSIVTGKAERGILICGSGIGMCIAANKYKGIRAAICCSADLAVRARLHNDANVLCFGADFITVPEALEITKTFLDTGFEGGRHQRRLDKISGIECSFLDNK